VKGWRSKFIFLCIVYFAGFATAIYMLAPPPEGQANRPDGSNTRFGFDSQEFVKSFNSGMHKCIDLGKVAALRTAKFIKEKAQEKQIQADS